MGDGLSQIEQIGEVSEILPSESEDLEFQGIGELFDQTLDSEEILTTSSEEISIPDFKQPSIKGLRKFRD